MNTLASDAVATMKRAEIIDGLTAVNARLRRENFAMLEALERTLANFKNLLERKPVRDASETIAESEAAIRLAKGESQ